MNTIALPQGTIRYEDVGRGPVIVFVHGLLVNGLLWRKVVPLLSPHARCIVPDLPLGSHEIPMNPDADLSVEGVAKIVADLLEALDLKDVTLVGNDSGGVVSQLVAARHRERVGRLVLTPCDAYECFPPPGFGYVKWVGRVPGLAAALSQAMLRVPPLRRLPIAYGALTKTPLPEDVLARWITPAATNRDIRRDVRKFARSTSNKITLRVAEELKSFPHPALLLWPPADRFFPISLAERLCADMPNARLEVIESAGVFLPEDQPEAMATAVSRFVTENVSAAPQPVVH